MLIYLAVIAVVCFAAAFCAYNYFFCLYVERRVSVYDARGFFLVMMVFISFGVISLSYFWGELRFYQGEGVLRESLIGVFQAVLCSLVSLSLGVSQFKKDH